MSAPLTSEDLAHLRRAVELAEGGRGRVSPNPLVGAVVVRDSAILGEGFHAELGGLHAERAALEDCRSRDHDPSGATMYVSLEPCAHQGRQPPCTEAILRAGISRVVIASDDPSEKASGRGPETLREGGVEVSFAEREEARAARLITQPFRKHARTGLPLVILKMAMSLDGQMSTGDKDSPWISGERSRALVHRWRGESDAIAVGIGTVLADDPLLTARGIPGARQPVRVVFDSQARLPLDSQLLRTLEQAPVIVVMSADADSASATALSEAGAELVVADGTTPEDRIRSALAELGHRGITSLFLEGGPTLATAFASAEEIDESRTFIAPLLLGQVEVGGSVASRTEGVGTGGVENGLLPARSAPPVHMHSVRQVALSSEVDLVGEDVLIKARFKEW